MGDYAARFCVACGAPSHRPAGADHADMAGAFDETPVQGYFLVDEPYTALFRGLRADQPGRQEDPYAALFAPPRDERTARRPRPDGRPQPAAPPGGPAPDWVSVPEWGSVPDWGSAPDGRGLPQYGWAGRRTPAAGSGKSIIFALLAVVALVAAGGGILGFEMDRHHPPPITPAAPRSLGASPQRTAPASSPPVVLGNSMVAVAPGVMGAPGAQRIVGLLTTYFRAVNAHDYLAYRRLLDPALQPEVTAARYGTGYRSTVDSGATLTGVSAAADGRATADIMFTSHQAPANSPDRSACTNWSVTLFLEQADGGYLIGRPPPRYRPAHQPC
jgi:hypothetical protein